MVNAAAKTVRLYDPLGGRFDDMMDKIVRWWTETDPDEERQDRREWQMHKDRMPRQLNDTDCGVMVCLAMHRLMLQSCRPRTLGDWGFTGAGGTRGRYRLINDLATNKIKERNGR